MRLYCVENMLTGLSLAVEAHYSDSEASVEMAPRVAHLDECRLWAVAEFDEKTRLVTPFSSPSYIEWDLRRVRPVRMAENVNSGSAAVDHFNEEIEKSVQASLSH